MNTEQENELATKIASLLNQGVRELDAQTAAKLLDARKEALAHFQDQPARAWAPAWATTAAGHITEPFNRNRFRNLLAGLILLAFLACVAGVVVWQGMGAQGNDVAELDQALLTDELPINAYLDKGFDSWLKRP